MFNLNEYVYVESLPGVHKITAIDTVGHVVVAPCRTDAPYLQLVVDESQLRLAPKKQHRTHTKTERTYIDQILNAQRATRRRKSSMTYDAKRIRVCKDLMEAALGYRPTDLLTGVRDLIMGGGRNEAQLANDPYTIIYDSLDDSTGHSN